MIAHVNGIDIGYDDTGTGFPIVLIHGFPHNRHLWDAQRDALRTANGTPYRVIIPDLRGFGESQGKAPYTMEQYADDIAGLLSQLNIQHAIIGGLSMGGYVAFALWRRHRQLIRALILADTRAAADTDEARNKRKTLIALAHDKGAAAVADNQMPGMVGKTTRETRPDIVQQLHTLLSSASVDGIVGALSAMMERPDSTPTLATIDVPTLVIVGDEDVLTPEKDARTIHAGIALSTLAILPHAGHVSCVETPAQFNATVVDFLRKHAA